MEDHRNVAATKLQKVYKSFRTRRRLADCAVLAEHKWWQVLDFAELKRSSISFFDIEKPESAISRWCRARTKAAKVGKGSSKDEKSRKLALQHWLEAIDPRHRYGHNLQFYYVRWLHCKSNQPFFYWLDIGEGRGIDIIERCPRSRLQQQCIKYLDPAEREEYEVIVENGRFMYKASQKVVDTTAEPKGSKWIFVLSTTRTLYVAQKIKGKFQHSSFLAGGATLSAGRLIVYNGILTSVWPHSGHYLPTEENFQAFMIFLAENNVDLTRVKWYTLPFYNRFYRSNYDCCFSQHVKEHVCTTFFGLPQHVVRSNGHNLTCRTGCKQKAPMDEEDGGVYNSTQDENEEHQPKLSKLSEVATSKILLKRSQIIRSKIARLKIPSIRTLVEEEFKTPQLPPEDDHNNLKDEQEEEEDEFLSDDGFETAEESFLSEDDFMCPKLNLFELHEDPKFEEPLSEATILKRIHSHRRTQSYQLGEHLQFRWTTGAGPRIGCVRDYPSRLQFQVLEQVHLSPRKRLPSPLGSSLHQAISTKSTLAPEKSI